MIFRSKLFYSAAIIAVLFHLLLSSCGKTMNSYVVRGEFHYINQTQRNLKIVVYGQMINGSTLQTYNLQANDSLVLYTEGETDAETADPFGYVPAISGDTTILMIDDTLCYKEFNYRGPELQKIGTYINHKRGPRDYIFRCRIDSNIVARAGRCL